MKNSDFLERWYKNKIEESKEIPPDDIWKNISKELDIYAVWNNISTELDRKESKKRRRAALIYIFSIAGLFFVAAWMFLKYEFSPVNSNSITNNKATSSNTPPITDSNGIIKKNIGKKLIANDNKAINADASDNSGPPEAGLHLINRGVTANSTASIPGATISVTNTTAPVISATITATSVTVPLTGALHITKVNERSSINDYYNSDSGISDHSYDLNEERTEREYILPINLFEKYLYLADTNLIVQRQPYFDTLTNSITPKEKSNAGRLYAGVIFSVQNPWLINRYTYNCLLESSINEAVLGVGICYGISSAYNFAHGWCINSDILIQSSYGQAYNSYNNGTYEKEKINLDYKQINLYGVKRKDRLLKNKNLVFSNGPLLGINVKYLYHASKSINGLKNDATKQYAKYDFGALIGYEYSLSVKTKWMFCASINCDLGLNNVYIGKGSESKRFNQTRNSSLRIGIAVRYRLK